jgi:hypothetical protein
MNPLDKYQSIVYIVEHHPVCDDCSRGNLNEIRKAAGMYQSVKDILNDTREHFKKEELDELIRKAAGF